MDNSNEYLVYRLCLIVLLSSLKVLETNVISGGMIIKQQPDQPVDDVQLTCEARNAPNDDP